MVSQDYNGVRINLDRIKQVPSFFYGTSKHLFSGQMYQARVRVFFYQGHILMLYLSDVLGDGIVRERKIAVEK